VIVPATILAKNNNDEVIVVFLLFLSRVRPSAYAFRTVGITVSGIAPRQVSKIYLNR